MNFTPSTVSSETTSDTDQTTQAHIVKFVIPLFFSLIILFGSIGNSLVIAVFALNHAMRNSTNVLILNLAVADLAFLLFCVPFTAAQYSIYQWPFGQVWCKTVSYLQYVSALGSVWTIVLMAIERFLAVAFPAKAAVSIRNLKTSSIAIGTIWIVILASQSHTFFTHGTIEYEFPGYSRRLSCILLAERPDQDKDINRNNTSENRRQLFVRLHYWSFNLIAFVIPLCITSILYTMMTRILWKNTLKLTLSESSIKMKKRVTKMVFMVTVTFTICWLPENIWFMWKASIFPQQMTTSSFWLGIQLTAQLLSYLNSCVNPFLYGAMSTNFRHGFANTLNLIFCRKMKHRLQRQESSRTRTILRKGQHRLSMSVRLKRQFSKTGLLRRQTTRDLSDVKRDPLVSNARKIKRFSLPTAKFDRINSGQHCLLSPTANNKHQQKHLKEQTMIPLPTTASAVNVRSSSPPLPQQQQQQRRKQRRDQQSANASTAKGGHQQNKQHHQSKYTNYQNEFSRHETFEKSADPPDIIPCQQQYQQHQQQLLLCDQLRSPASLKYDNTGDGHQDRLHQPSSTPPSNPSTPTHKAAAGRAVQEEEEFV